MTNSNMKYGYLSNHVTRLSERSDYYVVSVHSNLIVTIDPDVSECKTRPTGLTQPRFVEVGTTD